MKRLPIQAAKDISKKYKQAQVILVTWDEADKLVHTVSYGDTLDNCEKAAVGANVVRKALGFPEELCQAVPARVRRKATKKTKGESVP
jgi:hypothetical protein